jgi:hypothetical protein
VSARSVTRSVSVIAAAADLRIAAAHFGRAQASCQGVAAIASFALSAASSTRRIQAGNADLAFTETTVASSTVAQIIDAVSDNRHGPHVHVSPVPALLGTARMRNFFGRWLPVPRRRPSVRVRRAQLRSNGA